MCARACQSGAVEVRTSTLAAGIVARRRPRWRVAWVSLAVLSWAWDRSKAHSATDRRRTLPINADSFLTPTQAVDLVELTEQIAKLRILGASSNSLEVDDRRALFAVAQFLE